MEARKAKINMWTAAGVGAVAYAFAYWCEAAYYAERWEWLERITWSRLMAALPGVSWADLGRVNAMPADFLVLAGSVLVGVLASGIHRAAWRAATPAILAAYSALLVLAGGWAGILVLLALPWDRTMDGEFFGEGFPRFVATGICALGTIVLAISTRKRSQAESQDRSRSEAVVT